MKMNKLLSFPKHFAICTLQFALCIILLLSLFSCGSNTAPSGTGSVSFGLVFQKTPSKAALRSPNMASTGDICFDYGITTVTGKVYNAATNQTVTGGPWPCQDHQGKINNVPPATGLNVTVEGTVNGSVVWTGQKTNVSVTEGQDSNIGAVPFNYVGGDTTPPTITSVTPANNAPSVPVTSAVTAIFSEDMSATSIDPATFTVHQGSNSVPGAVSYDVPSKTASFQPSTAFANSTTYTATINTNVKDLAMNRLATAYTWMFTTEYALGSAPPTPANVQATASDKQVVISWATVTGATSYNIYWANSSVAANKAMGTPISITASPYTHTSLTNGTAYYYVVTAVNANGESAESTPVKSATPGAAPLAPTNLTVSPGSGQNGLNWTFSTGGTSYNIYWSLSSSVSKTSGTKITPAGLTDVYTHTGLANGTTYYYVVTAENGYGESIESNVVSAAPGTAPSVPAGVAATAGNGQVAINWSAATGATSYNIYWSLATGVTKSSTKIVVGLTNPYTHTGRTNGTAYYYVVTSANSFGESAVSTEVTATPGNVPLAPANVAVNPGNTQNVVSWTTSTGAASYNIYWSLSSGVTKTTGTKIAGASSPYTHTGRTNGTTYYYVVTTVNTYGESAESQPVVSAMPGTVPASPTAVSASAGVGQLSISWSGVSGATSYNLYWSTTSGVTKGSGTKVTAVTNPYVLIGNSETVYYFVVTAVNGIGESAESVEGACATGYVPPVPTNIVVVPGNNSNLLTWTASTGAASYNIYWSLSSSVSKTNGTKISTGSSPLSYTQSSLTNGTTYYYVVTAVSSYGESADSQPVVSASPGTAPVAPAGVTATAGIGQVSISWPPATGATSYEIYWSLASGVTKSTGTELIGVSSPYLFTGNNGTTYHFVVTASNSFGETVESNEVSATPSATPLPPTGVSASAGYGQITASWSAVNGATSYNIYYSLSAGVTTANGTKLAAGASPSDITGLADNTKYYFMVTALNGAAESAASGEVFATTWASPTPPGPPAKPRF